jgi:hypothetical protein
LLSASILLIALRKPCTEYFLFSTLIGTKVNFKKSDTFFANEVMFALSIKQELPTETSFESITVTQYKDGINLLIIV